VHRCYFIKTLRPRGADGIRVRPAEPVGKTVDCWERIASAQFVGFVEAIQQQIVELPVSTHPHRLLDELLPDRVGK
jgi:hypothetical protein